MREYPLGKARMDFPLLTQRIRGKPLVYLDSAATTLKPWPVIEKVGHFLTYQTANVHRGAHFLSDQATGEYEAARQTVADFIGASQASEVVWTRGTTESVNLAAQTWGRKHIKKGDVILLSEMEHHSNIVPWQLLAESTGVIIKAIPVTPAGELDLDAAEKLLTENVKLLAIAHVSNTLGTVNDLSWLVKKARSVGAKIFVDGAQAVANRPLNMRELDVDFYAFSGHKMFAPYGIGVLYGKKELLDELPPYQGGGSMISKVSFEGTTYHEVPHRFEAGTPNIEGVLGLAAAVSYIKKLGWDGIQKQEESLLQEATEKIKDIPGLRIIGEAKNKVAILSFLLGNNHPSDVGQILDQENVAVRSGHHCTQPLMQKFGIPGTVRASFSVYNSSADIDQLVKGLLKAKELLT